VSTRSASPPATSPLDVSRHRSPGAAERWVSSPIALTLLVVLAIAVRTWAYAADVSLALDEILLSRNILGLSLRDLLLEPLRLDQVAPRGFLLVEKLAVMAFGENERALRLFPFLCAIASVFLFRRVAERALVGLAVPFALVLFAVGIPFIQFGVEVKQYAVDAAAALLLLSLVLGLREPNVSSRRLMLVGAVGWIVIWFSQASVIVMGGLGLALAVEWLIARDRATTRALFITIPLWAAASVVAIVAGLRSMTPSTREFMDDFWRGGFMPTPVTSASALRWFWNQTLSAFTDPTLLRYSWPVLFLCLAALGVAVTWRRQRVIALLLAGPFAVAVVAAVAHQYPLRGRLMFYLMPALLVTIAAGAEWIRDRLASVHPVLGASAMTALLVPAALGLVRDHPPYEIEHHRTVLAYLQKNRKPGDRVHVFPLSRMGVLFYGARYDLKLSDWTTAACDRNETRPYLRDVDQYRGANRVWLLTSGSRPYRSARAAVRDYLGKIGTKRDSLVLESLTGTVSLEMYDLSDSTRLQAADAESFPVQPMPKDPRPGCRPWIRPSPADSLR